MKSHQQLQAETLRLLEALKSNETSKAISLINSSIINRTLVPERTALVLASSDFLDYQIVDTILKHKDFNYTSHNQLATAIKDALIKYFHQSKEEYQEVILLLLSHKSFHSEFCENILHLGDIADNHSTDPIIKLIKLIKVVHYNHGIWLRIKYQYAIAKAFKNLNTDITALEWEYLAISEVAKIMKPSGRETIINPLKGDSRLGQYECITQPLKNTVKYYMEGQSSDMPYKITQTDAFNAAMALAVLFMTSWNDSALEEEYLNYFYLAQQINSGASQVVGSNRQQQFLQLFTKFHSKENFTLNNKLDLLVAVAPLLQIPTTESLHCVSWICNQSYSDKTLADYILGNYLLHISEQSYCHSETVRKYDDEISALVSLYGLGDNIDLDSAILKFETIAGQYIKSDKHRAFNAYVLSLIAQHKLSMSRENHTLKRQKSIIEQTIQSIQSMAATYDSSYSIHYTTLAIELVLHFLKESNEISNKIILLKCIFQIYQILSAAGEKIDLVKKNLNYIWDKITKANLFENHIHAITKMLSDALKTAKNSDIRSMVVNHLFDLIKQANKIKLSQPIEYAVNELFIETCSNSKLSYTSDQVDIFRAQLERMEQIAVKNPQYDVGLLYINLVNILVNPQDKFDAYEKAVELRHPKAAIDICKFNPNPKVDINRVVKVLHQALSMAFFPVVNTEVITKIHAWLVYNKQYFPLANIEIEQFIKFEAFANNAKQYLKGDLTTLVVGHNFLPALIKLVNDQPNDSVTLKKMFLSIKLLLEMTLNATFIKNKYGLLDNDIEIMMNKSFNFLSELAYGKIRSINSGLAHSYMQLYVLYKHFITEQIKQNALLPSCLIPEYDVDAIILGSVVHADVKSSLMSSLAADDIYVNKLKTTFDNNPSGTRTEQSLTEQDNILPANSISHEIIRVRKQLEISPNASNNVSNTSTNFVRTSIQSGYSNVYSRLFPIKKDEEKELQPMTFKQRDDNSDVKDDYDNTSISGGPS